MKYCHCIILAQHHLNNAAVSSRVKLHKIIFLTTVIIRMKQYSKVSQQLNFETGKIPWNELQRYFARGVVIKIAPELDLIDVAEKFVTDDKQTIHSWMNQGSIERATDEDAIRWSNLDPLFWAVVTAPWVLVQEILRQ